MAFSSWRTWSTGEVVTAAHMNQEVRDNGEALFPNENATVSWTPTLAATGTNPTAGAGVGRRWRVGPLQFVWVRFTLTEGGGSGTYSVSLPVSSSGLGTGNNGTVVGEWRGVDASNPGNSTSGAVILGAAGGVRFGLPTGTLVSASSPFSWGVDDVLTFHAVYPVA